MGQARRRTGTVCPSASSLCAGPGWLGSTAPQDQHAHADGKHGASNRGDHGHGGHASPTPRLLLQRGGLCRLLRVTLLPMRITLLHAPGVDFQSGPLCQSCSGDCVYVRAAQLEQCRIARPAAAARQRRRRSLACLSRAGHGLCGGMLQVARDAEKELRLILVQLWGRRCPL